MKSAFAIALAIGLVTLSPALKAQNGVKWGIYAGASIHDYQQSSFENQHRINSYPDSYFGEVRSNRLFPMQKAFNFGVLVSPFKNKGYGINLSYQTGRNMYTTYSQSDDDINFYFRAFRTEYVTDVLGYGLRKSLIEGGGHSMGAELSFSAIWVTDKSNLTIIQSPQNFQSSSSTTTVVSFHNHYFSPEGAFPLFTNPKITMFSKVKLISKVHLELSAHYQINVAFAAGSSSKVNDFTGFGFSTLLHYWLD